MRIQNAQCRLYKITWYSNGSTLWDCFLIARCCPMPVQRSVLVAHRFLSVPRALWIGSAHPWAACAWIWQLLLHLVPRWTPLVHSCGFQLTGVPNIHIYQNQNFPSTENHVVKKCSYWESKQPGQFHRHTLPRLHLYLELQYEMPEVFMHSSTGGLLPSMQMCSMYITSMGTSWNMPLLMERRKKNMEERVSFSSFHCCWDKAYMEICLPIPPTYFSIPYQARKEMMSFPSK